MVMACKRLITAAATAAVGLAFVLSASAAPDVQGTLSQSLQPPRLVVQQRSSAAAPGYIFVAPKEGPGQRGPEIADDRGRPVWFSPVAGGEADDFRVQNYLGQPVLTWWQGSGFGGRGEGVDYIADSSYRVIATVHAGNGLAADGHEFLLTPQGTALITVYRDVPYDLRPVGGPREGQATDCVVQEIDVATGRVVFEWHSIDHVPIDESHEPLNPEGAYDYFHVNAVNLDEDGNLLISARHTWTIYKVDRHSGRVIWRLGGRRSDFALAPGAQFAWQHNALPAGESTIRIFDNENNGSDRVMSKSRVIWIRLDLAAKTAALLKTVSHPSTVSASSQGNAQALANGDTFVGWGDTGRVSEFGPDGKLLFDALLSGYQTYRAYRFQWTGRPTAPPTATARRKGRRSTTVHAIWNGATSVARWRVLGGRSTAHLRPLRVVPWNGLDTAIKIKGVPKIVQVVALDERRAVLDTSPPVRVSK